MVNARILNIENIDTARDEIRKIGVDDGALPWLSPKAVFITMKIEDVSAFAANIIKQEMLGKGGDAAVNRGVADFSVKRSDVLVMGTYGQFKSLVKKLAVQSGSLKVIGEEIQRVLGAVDRGKPQFFECGKYRLPIGKKTYVMGILNFTPDSFSDGGMFNNMEISVKRAREMVEEGADIIDIGGESTRPGYEPVSPEEEASRVIPVIEALVREINVPVSVDTMKAVVAEKALQAGASIVNDIWGLQRDPEMAGVAAKYGAGVIMMHNQDEKVYKELMGDIMRFLRNSVDIAEKAGLGREKMVVDPGIGFGKTSEHNIEVLKRLKELNSLNLPVLLGTSRKSFIGNILGLPAGERMEGTAATVALGIADGVDIMRVHDVKEMARVARVTDAILRRNHG